MTFLGKVWLPRQAYVTTDRLFVIESQHRTVPNMLTYFLFCVTGNPQNANDLLSYITTNLLKDLFTWKTQLGTKTMKIVPSTQYVKRQLGRGKSNKRHVPLSYTGWLGLPTAARYISLMFSGTVFYPLPQPSAVSFLLSPKATGLR